MKHYVKITHKGKTVADARIEAESPSAAVKAAMLGQGIELPDLDPDESYRVSSGDVSSSSFGDEFVRTAEFTGDDESLTGGYLHGPKPQYEVSWTYVEDPCKEISPPGSWTKFRDEWMSHAEAYDTPRRSAQLDVVDPPPQRVAIDYTDLEARLLRECMTATPVDRVMTYDFECDCGNVTTHAISRYMPQVSHTCCNCGANYVTRLEQ